jgi:uncharacterized protein DUF3300
MALVESRRSGRSRRNLQALCCAILMMPGEGIALALEAQAPPQASQQPAPPAAQQPAKPPAAQPPAAAAGQQPGAQTGSKQPQTAPETAKLPPDQLESLVAPIALYPDSLLAQTLVASTYPLEIVQLQQWLEKNKTLKDKALADAVAKQPWDTSIQSMAATPEVVKRLADDIQWTTDLGNAFLAQQADVMDAVQRMRKKAKDKGALESNDKQKVEEKKVEEKTVIIVESANPEVIYVPSYSPTVVYGPPVYPYPPIYYPPYPPGAAFVSFSFGVMWGAAMWGGSCCGCGWGGSNVNINVNNNFNKINHYNGGNRGGAGGGNWQHNPQHRGAAPYGDRGTANKYGGSARGDAPRASQQGGAGTRGGGGGAPGVSDRSAGGAGNRGGAPSASDRSAGGAGNRGGGGAGGAGVSDRSAGSAGSRGGAGAGSGGDKVGSRNIPSSGSSSRGGGGFGGGSSGWSGSSARSSSSRGSSSMGGRSRGGGGGRGGRR